MTRILVISGTDSSGGAGLSRDVAAATGAGCDVAPVIGAVTVQTDGTLRHIHPVPPAVIRAQIDAAVATRPVTAVKIGMVGTARAVNTVAAALDRPDMPVVLDPVLGSSSGGILQTPGDLAPLLRRATLITPNLIEAALLTGTDPAKTPDQIAAQAAALRDQGAQAVLIKGGHGRGPLCTDRLFDATGPHEFSAPRLPQGRRGTGCTLSTLIACQLGRGAALPQACRTAIAQLRDWLGASG